MVLVSCDWTEGERAQMEEAIELNVDAKHYFKLNYHRPQTTTTTTFFRSLMWFKVVNGSFVWWSMFQRCGPCGRLQARDARPFRWYFYFFCFRQTPLWFFHPIIQIKYIFIQMIQPNYYLSLKSVFSKLISYFSSIF